MTAPTTAPLSAEQLDRNQYRKKPVVIEAIQWPGTKFESVPPKWFTDAMYVIPGQPGMVMRYGDDILIETLEGQMRAQPGDWIIRGIKGEIYPCKPDIFAATYEPTAAQALPPQPVGERSERALFEAWAKEKRPFDDVRFTGVAAWKAWQERSKHCEARVADLVMQLEQKEQARISLAAALEASHARAAVSTRASSAPAEDAKDSQTKPEGWWERGA